MKVLVTGAGGMVGRAVVDYCKSIGDEVVAFAHAGLDIANREAVERAVSNTVPDLIINCAAWTDVDASEADPEKAFAVNAKGPENLARASRQHRVRLVTISTDYVFDGRKDGYYTQHDDPNPQSVYAASKLEGEARSRTEYENTIVARTGFVFGPGGNNFLSKIVERAQAGHTIHAISDAYGTPTYARDLAVRLRELGQQNHPGIYHVVNAGEGVSFEAFAEEALKIAGYHDVEIVSVTMDELKRPAPRPRNSRLRCNLSPEIGLPAMRDWRAALREFVERETSRSTGLLQKVDA